MSQVESTAIGHELSQVLTVTNAHSAMVFLVKKHGPTDFPEHLDVFLSYLGMLNPNLQWDKYPLFAKMLGVCVQDNDVLASWYGENHIYSTIVNHYKHVNDLQAEVNSVLFPQPQTLATDIKLG